MHKTSWTAALMAMVIALVAIPVAASPTEAEATAQAPRRLTIDDFFRLGEVNDPQISPDGQWIAYTIKTRDLEKDKTYTQIWMVPTAGGEAIAMSAGEQNSSHPRWSPDGQYLGFLSARDEAKTQVWTLFRQGGEAIQRTDTPQDVSSFEWSPDGSKMVLVLQDPKPAELEAHAKGEDYEEKTAPPWVIDREQFKVDYTHYLDRRRTHLFVLDLASGKTTQITSGDFDDSEPAWSPDGSRIAFVSNRTDRPDTNYNSDIWVVYSDNTDKGAQLHQITTNPGPDSSPAWSPDSKRIAHLSETDIEAMLYATRHLAVSAASGGEFRVLTEDLDRIVMAPEFSLDGNQIYIILEDSGEQNLARIPIRGGEVDRLISGTGVVSAFDLGPSGEIAALVTQPKQPAEVFLYTAGQADPTVLHQQGTPGRAGTRREGEGPVQECRRHTASKASSSSHPTSRRASAIPRFSTSMAAPNHSTTGASSTRVSSSRPMDISSCNPILVVLPATVRSSAGPSGRPGASPTTRM